MVEAQVDPMEPPKHKHKKIPRGSGSPPVPVLHSPPRKLTVEDQQAWKIPPCVSNWKNARGYTIPLDKRLAADGRGLQETTINNKFATLTESLYIAERKASEELKIRNQIRKKMSMKEKEDKEAELREMANRARLERSGVMDALGGLSAYGVEDLDDPSDEKDYYRSNTRTAAAGLAMNTSDPRTHYHSGGGGAASGTGGAYGQDVISDSEDSRSSDEVTT
jgi:SNW domain-containing protein 1